MRRLHLLHLLEPKLRVELEVSWSRGVCPVPRLLLELPLTCFSDPTQWTLR